MRPLRAIRRLFSIVIRTIYLKMRGRSSIGICFFIVILKNIVLVVCHGMLPFLLFHASYYFVDDTWGLSINYVLASLLQHFLNSLLVLLVEGRLQKRGGIIGVCVLRFRLARFVFTLFLNFTALGLINIIHEIRYTELSFLHRHFLLEILSE
jgi:hypothetical protein